MEVVEATGRILEAGKSPELTALLASVAEATSSDGEPRYAARTYLDLTQSIVCRTYAKPVLQLCHMVNAADACGNGPDRWERLFYGVDSARSSAFKGYIRATLGVSGWRRPGFEATSDGISVQYSDGIFNIRYGRMPLLAALLETALTMVGYVAINDVFATMFERNGDQSAVGDAANELNKLIYGYLRDHLPSHQSADKLEAILGFLNTGAREGSVDIDDETVLQFWCAQGQSDSSAEGDFRAFKTAVGAFIDFLRALDTGDSRRAVKYAGSIGSDGEAGEIDPGEIDDDDLMAGGWISPLATLDEPPVDAIKFLNKKEREDVDLLMDCGPLVENLPLTIIRSDVFGAWQARITQATRRNRDRKILAPLIACDEIEAYAERCARYADVEKHLDRVQKAAFHALLSDAAMAMDEDDRGDNVVPLFGNRVDAPANVLEEAEDAFRNISRKGFREADLGDPEIRDGFRIGTDALIQIREHLGRYLTTLDRLEAEDPELAEQFEADLKTFRDRFSVLYGGAS